MELGNNKSSLFSEKEKKSAFFKKDEIPDDLFDEQPLTKWKLLIVDDEYDIHTVTRMALRSFVFQGEKLTFLSAYSSAEAQQLMKQHPDVAVVLLDVVMEHEQAGLEFVYVLRDVQKNHFSRVILRTGQPGQAPEKEVITKYEINDYKTKTELTQDKLYASVWSALRTYDALVTVDEQRRNLEAKVQERTHELEQQRNQLHKRNKEFTDSINYAKRIQDAVLPLDDSMQQYLKEFFVLFKPRNIVSGDFYWLKHISDYTVLVVADCTGHGVPGAFMSMLGVSYLNEVVSRMNAKRPGLILDELRNQLKRSLRQTGKQGEQRDGIDLALVVISHRDNMMYCSCAQNPVCIARSKDIPADAGMEIKSSTDTHDLYQVVPDRQPIGISVNETPFASHTIQLHPNDALYLFSDGYADQTGGEQDKKYMSKHFKEKLLQLSQLPMQEQKSILETTFEQWKQDKNQVDDVLVVGIRV